MRENSPRAIHYKFRLVISRTSRFVFWQRCIERCLEAKCVFRIKN